MSWETVESLPGQRRGGGAFRGQAEPVVAERKTPTPRELFVLFWRSTPELTYRRSAKRLVLTPSHLYVERLDGQRQRVARGALRGRRMDRGRVVYGIVDGEDLALLPRAGCEVVDALEAQLRGEEEPLPPYVVRRYRHVSAIALAMGVLAPLVFEEDYPIADGLARVQSGNYTSEVSLAFFAMVAAMLAGVAIFMTVPQRIRIDALGVHLARGFFPWLHTLYEPESVRVVVSKSKRRPRSTSSGFWAVSLLPKRGGPIHLQLFSIDSGRAREEAFALANRVGKLLDREIEFRP